MTKHLSNAVILKHLQNLHLRHTSGRADAAANTHALRQRAESTTGKVDRRLKSEKADVDNAKELFKGPAWRSLVRTRSTAVACGYSPRREM